MMAFLAVLLMVPGFALLLIALGLLGALNGAYPFMTLWSWFVVPVFGAPPITFGQTIGLLLLLHLARGTSPQHSERPTSDKVADVVAVLLFPWITLSVAWVVRAVWL